MVNPPTLAAQISSHLLRLLNRNAFFVFETLCRHIAKEAISDRILPSTGPVQAGGDGGRDFETFRSYIEDAWQGDEIQPWFGSPNRTSTSILVFLCTLQTDNLQTKVHKDLAKVHAHPGPKIETAYFFTPGPLPKGHQLELQRTAWERWETHLVVLDGEAISDLLCQPSLRWAAVHYLDVPQEIANAEVIPHPIEQEILTKYKDAVFEANSFLDHWLPSHVRDEHDADDLYQSLDIKSEGLQPRSSTIDSDQLMTITSPLDAVLSTHRVLITGDAGSGKTWAARAVTRDLARRRPDPDDIVPVLLELGQIADAIPDDAALDRNSALSFALRTACARVRESVPETHRDLLPLALRQAEARAFIIDGLDEVMAGAPETGRRVMNFLSQLGDHGRLEPDRILIFTRPEQRQRLSELQLDQWHLERMTRRQRMRLVTHWFEGDVPSGLRARIESEDHSLSSRLPLFLVLLCIAHDSRTRDIIGETPRIDRQRSVPWVYETALQRLVANEGRFTEERNSRRIVHKLRLLENCAWMLVGRGWERVAPESDLEDHVRESDSWKFLATHRWQTDVDPLEELRQRDGVLHRQWIGPGHHDYGYGIVHDGLTHFLIAESVAMPNRPSSISEVVRRLFWEGRDWPAVVSIAFAIAHDREEREFAAALMDALSTAEDGDPEFRLSQAIGLGVEECPTCELGHDLDRLVALIALSVLNPTSRRRGALLLTTFRELGHAILHALLDVSTPTHLRVAAAEALLEAGDDSGLEILLEAASSGDDHSAAAASTVTRWAVDEQRKDILRLGLAGPPHVVHVMLSGLSEVGLEEVDIFALQKLVTGQVPGLQRYAASLLLDLSRRTANPDALAWLSLNAPASTRGDANGIAEQALYALRDVEVDRALACALHLQDATNGELRFAATTIVLDWATVETSESVTAILRNLERPRALRVIDLLLRAKKPSCLDALIEFATYDNHSPEIAPLLVDSLDLRLGQDTLQLLLDRGDPHLAIRSLKPCLQAPAGFRHKLASADNKRLRALGIASFASDPDGGLTQEGVELLLDTDAVVVAIAEEGLRAALSAAGSPATIVRLVNELHKSANNEGIQAIFARIANNEAVLRALVDKGPREVQRSAGDTLVELLRRRGDTNALTELTESGDDPVAAAATRAQLQLKQQRSSPGAAARTSGSEPRNVSARARDELAEESLSHPRPAARWGAVTGFEDDDPQRAERIALDIITGSDEITASKAARWLAARTPTADTAHALLQFGSLAVARVGADLLCDLAREMGDLSLTYALQDHGDLNIRRIAAETALELGDESGMRELWKQTDHRDPSVRGRAANAILDFAERSKMTQLVGRLITLRQPLTTRRGLGLLSTWALDDGIAEARDVLRQLIEADAVDIDEAPELVQISWRLMDRAIAERLTTSRHQSVQLEGLLQLASLGTVDSRLQGLVRSPRGDVAARAKRSITDLIRRSSDPAFVLRFTEPEWDAAIRRYALERLARLTEITGTDVVADFPSAPGHTAGDSATEPARVEVSEAGLDAPDLWTRLLTARIVAREAVRTGYEATLLRLANHRDRSVRRECWTAVLDGRLDDSVLHRVRRALWATECAAYVRELDDLPTLNALINSTIESWLPAQ